MIDLLAAAASLGKAAAVIFAMTLLEWAKLRERAAQADTAKAKSDLEVEKIKTEAATDARDEKQVLDDFLVGRGLGPSSPRRDTPTG